VGVDPAIGLQIPVCIKDGTAVYPQFFRQPSFRREAITGLEDPGQDEFADLVPDLLIYRN
jgi:hypothetical protein